MTIEDHRIRLVPDVPHVYSAGDAVMLQLSEEQARVLVEILGHYDVLTEKTSDTRPTGYASGVWVNGVLVDLAAARGRVQLRNPVKALDLQVQGAEQ